MKGWAWIFSCSSEAARQGMQERRGSDFPLQISERSPLTPRLGEVQHPMHPLVKPQLGYLHHFAPTGLDETDKQSVAHGIAQLSSGIFAVHGLTGTGKSTAFPLAIAHCDDLIRQVSPLASFVLIST